MQQDICEIPRWQQFKRLLNNLTPQEFRHTLSDTPNAVLLDVRTPEEYAIGHIPGAINLDYLSPDFWDRMEQLDRDRSYFVYCRTSRRSVRTCTLMRNDGFRRIYHLDGGWNLWTVTFPKESATLE